jgi:DeoR family transcriptional regulator, aga operon transcriptional repressor
METDQALSNVERQERLLRFIERRERVTIAQICDEFAISPATARRDLDALAAQGQIQRFHGGAIPARRAPPELPVLQRMDQQPDEKRRIGHAAAQLVGDGETVFLSSGTTALEVARGLLGRKNLAVITNSLLVVDALVEVPDITVVSLGGLLRREELSLIGHLTEQALAEVRADKVIVGIRAVDVEQGLTNQYLPETLTDRAILKIGRQVILVADHTKCGRVATAFLAPLSAVDVLVTDSGVAPEFEAALVERGIRVIKA